MGDAKKDDLRVGFDRRLKLKFCGSKVTTAETVCEEPIMTIDYYPTLLELLGINGDAEHNQSIDGQSIKRLLENPAATIDRSLYWHYPHYHAGGDGPYSPHFPFDFPHFGTRFAPDPRKTELRAINMPR